MPSIHPSAVVSVDAELADDVDIGPGVVIGPKVSIGAGCIIGPHVIIEGITAIGKNNRFYGGAHIGCHPQDKKYKGEPTELRIGDHNTFFQCVTVSTGTIQDKIVTEIGNNNWFMAYVHIAHDCKIGNHTVFANSATLGGHVHIGDHVILGGLCAVHQFCIVGECVMAGGGAIITQDVPPFVVCEGNRARVHGINIEGLKRRGYPSEQIALIKWAYKTVYRQGLLYEEAIQHIQTRAVNEQCLEPFISFFKKSKRGILR